MVELDINVGRFGRVADEANCHNICRLTLAVVIDDHLVVASSQFPNDPGLDRIRLLKFSLRLLLDVHASPVPCLDLGGVVGGIRGLQFHILIAFQRRPVREPDYRRIVVEEIRGVLCLGAPPSSHLNASLSTDHEAIVRDLLRIEQLKLQFRSFGLGRDRKPKRPIEVRRHDLQAQFAQLVFLLADHDRPLRIWNPVHLLRPVDADRHLGRAPPDYLRGERSLEHLVQIDRSIKKFRSDLLAPDSQLVDTVSPVRPDASFAGSPNRGLLTVFVATAGKH